MKNKLNIICVLLVAFLFLLTTPVYADIGNSITVDLSVENHTKPLEGGRFGLIKILDINDGEYSVNEAVAELNINIDDILNNPEEQAQKLSEQISSTRLEEKKTDNTGKVVYDQLSDGIYLICQLEYDKTENNDADNYTISPPVLIQVPEWEVEALKNTVTIYPKVTKTDNEVPPEEPIDEEKVATGEAPQTHQSILFFGLSLVLLTTLIVKGGKKYEK